MLLSQTIVGFASDTMIFSESDQEIIIPIVVINPKNGVTFWVKDYRWGGYPFARKLLMAERPTVYYSIDWQDKENVGLDHAFDLRLVPEYYIGPDTVEIDQGLVHIIIQDDDEEKSRESFINDSCFFSLNLTAPGYARGARSNLGFGIGPALTLLEDEDRGFIRPWTIVQLFFTAEYLHTLKGSESAFNSKSLMNLGFHVNQGAVLGILPVGISGTLALAHDFNDPYIRCSFGLSVKHIDFEIGGMYNFRRRRGYWLLGTTVFIPLYGSYY